MSYIILAVSFKKERADVERNAPKPREQNEKVMTEERGHSVLRFQYSALRTDCPAPALRAPHPARAALPFAGDARCAALQKLIA